MNVLFFIFLTIGLFVIQTVIFPSFSFFPHIFDLMIIDILYLSLVARRHTAVLGIIFIGCLMDSVSGVPFFYYTFSYLWIYIIMLLFKQMFFQHTLVFILVASLISILIQHGFLILAVFISNGPAALSGLNVSLMIHQLICGSIVIPPILWLLNASRRHFVYTLEKITKQAIKNYKGEL